MLAILHHHDWSDNGQRSGDGRGSEESYCQCWQLDPIPVNRPSALLPKLAIGSQETPHHIQGLRATGAVRDAFNPPRRSRSMSYRATILPSASPPSLSKR